MRTDDASLSQTDAAALAEAFRAAGFRTAGLRRLWDSVAADALERGDGVPARRLVARHPDSPAAILARLFIFGDAVPAASTALALDDVALAAAERLGVLERTLDGVRPLCVIRPYAIRDAAGTDEWWIASDLDELAGISPLREDHVLGVGGAGRTLAALLPPRPAELALDLGCGCGILSLHLRRFASRVIATDISPRALWFTRLNALLNGVPHIETRLGSLYDPVAEERFDRIASNPPFVITPRGEGVPTYEYRDGGFAGDALMQAVVEGVGDRLVPGGTAHLLGNWESALGRDGLDRVGTWTATLDSWVIQRDRLDPAQYAELWVRDGGTRPGTPESAALVGVWLDDFEARGVDEVGMGWMLLRQPHDGAPTLARREELTQPLTLDDVGTHLANALDAWDALTTLDDVAFAASVLLVADDVTEARHLLPGNDAPSVIELHQGGALARTISVDTALAALVGACDGDLTVGALIDAIAQLLEVDAVELRVDLLPRLRELMFSGLLSQA